jgi:hypothetical protein
VSSSHLIADLPKILLPPRGGFLAHFRAISLAFLGILVSLITL